MTGVGNLPAGRQGDPARYHFLVEFIKFFFTDCDAVGVICKRMNENM